mgnify:CR=1 FL=1
MSEQLNLDNIKQNLDFFHKMYNVVRIVDPLNKRVIGYHKSKICKTNEICYDYWENGKICDNCISVRAYHENKSFIKIEQKPDAIMMVTAVPIEESEIPIVLELLKNATDSMLIGSGNYNDGKPVSNIVSEINDIVVKDQLTSLYNRRFIDDRLPVDIIHATISKSPLSIIFLDVDNLKSINDTFGHSAGDLALKEVGKIIQKSIRHDNDWAARYGGDEFLICLNKIDYDEAYHIAERIRQNIENVSIPLSDRNEQLTLSLGIHTMKDSKLTAEEIISIADKKMYEAKKSGKNIICGNIE